MCTIFSETYISLPLGLPNVWPQPSPFLVDPYGKHTIAYGTNDNLPWANFNHIIVKIQIPGEFNLLRHHTFRHRIERYKREWGVAGWTPLTLREGRFRFPGDPQYSAISS